MTLIYIYNYVGIDILYNYCLVVSTNPLKNMSSSVGMIMFSIWGPNICGYHPLVGHIPTPLNKIPIYGTKSCSKAPTRLCLSGFPVNMAPSSTSGCIDGLAHGLPGQVCGAPVG